MSNTNVLEGAQCPLNYRSFFSKHICLKTSDSMSFQNDNTILRFIDEAADKLTNFLSGNIHEYNIVSVIDMSD